MNHVETYFIYYYVSAVLRSRGIENNENEFKDCNTRKCLNDKLITNCYKLLKNNKYTTECILFPLINYKNTLYTKQMFIFVKVLITYSSSFIFSLLGGSRIVQRGAYVIFFYD